MLSLLSNVKEIRILPMSKEEFDNHTIEEVQQNYFGYQLPILQQGVYKYKKLGLNVKEPALILFQYDRHIVAVAVLKETKKLPQPHQGYTGAHYFDVQSIAVLTPFTYNDLAKVFKQLKTFTQTKQKLDITGLSDLLSFIADKNIHFILPNNLMNENEEQFQKALHKITAENTLDLPIVPRDPITGSRTVTPRNPKFSKGALESANYQCEFDSNHQFFKSESTKQNYVEAHHLIPLSKQREFSYSLDVSANIVSLCPVCHRIIHHAPADAKKPILKHLLNARKNRLKKAGIEISLNNILDMY